MIKPHFFPASLRHSNCTEHWWFADKPPQFHCCGGVCDLHVPAWKPPVFPRALELHFPWQSSSEWPEPSPGSQTTRHTWRFLAATKGHTHTQKGVTSSNILWDFPLGEISVIPANSHITKDDRTKLEEFQARIPRVISSGFKNCSPFTFPLKQPFPFHSFGFILKNCWDFLQVFYIIPSVKEWQSIQGR